MREVPRPRNSGLTYFEPQASDSDTFQPVKEAATGHRRSTEPPQEDGPQSQARVGQADVTHSRISQTQVRQAAGRVLFFPDTALSESSDVSLVEMLVEGDVRAPRIVWQRFAPMVHRMLRRAFGPECDIEDMAQEVFLVLFRRAHTLREPQALRAFVISITAHIIRYELRRKAATRWLRFGEPSVAKAQDADLDAREAVKRLYRILDRLGSRDRTAFALRFLEGLEVAEIARALDVSLATTKRRLAHSWRRVVVHAQRDEALITYLAGLNQGGIA
jgi:RNA polymerase sigma-70 factor (ECF subfamily)